jgi:lysophospholipase L1-like esterase
MDLPTKNIIINTLLLISVIIVFLILTEGVLSLITFKSYHGNSVTYAEPLHRESSNKDIIYELIPNTKFLDNNNLWKVPIRINSYGFRGKEFEFQKKDEFRILILGDSVAFGGRVEESEIFTSLLEEKLEKEYSKKFEVINTAVVGYTTSQEIAFLKERGILFKPDLVILSFTLGNDFYMSRVYKETRTGSDGNPEVILSSAYAYPIPLILFPNSSNSKFLLKNSETYKFINLKLNGILSRFGITFQGLQYQEGIEKTKDAFGELGELSIKENIPVFVVSYPDRMRIIGNEVEWRNKMINMGRWNRMIAYRDILNDLTQKNKLGHLDLNGVFYVDSEPQDNLWINGLHFSEEGHKRVSKEMFDYLIKNEGTYLFRD